MTRTRQLLLAVGLYILVPLISVEAIVRWSGWADHLYTDGGLYEMSPSGNYWRFRPGFVGTTLGPTSVRIGPHGSRLHGTAGAQSRATVAIFGDSFTFGQGVADEQTFVARIEARLVEAGVLAKVLNFGVPGHTLEMEIAHLGERLEEIRPDAVVLAFPSMDLDPRRAENHVDRYGYLTKRVFGPPSPTLDFARLMLRQSRTALLVKHRILQLTQRRPFAAEPQDRVEPSLHSALTRYKEAIQRFIEATPSTKRIVICLDLRESPLSLEVHNVMDEQFPELEYLHAPSAFDLPPGLELRVPLDGHPNAIAHRTFAEMLVDPLLSALQAEADSESSAARPGTPIAR